MPKKYDTEPKTNVDVSRAEVLKMLSLDNFLHKQIMLVLLVKSKNDDNLEDGTFEMTYGELASRCNVQDTPEFRAHVSELSKTGFFSFEEVTRTIPLLPRMKPLICETVIFRVTFLTEEEQQSEDNQLTMELDTTPKPFHKKAVIASLYNQ